MEARNDFPKELLNLETSKGIAKPFKTDFLKREIWYSFEEGVPGNSFKLSVKEVKNIIQKNKRGIRPEVSAQTKEGDVEVKMEVSLEDRIDRFDSKNRERNKKRKNYRKRKIRQQ